MDAISRYDSSLVIFITFLSIAPHPRSCRVVLHLRLATCSRDYVAFVMRALHLLVWRAGDMVSNNTSLRVRNSAGKVLGIALARRFFMRQVLLDAIAQQHEVSDRGIREVDDFRSMSSASDDFYQGPCSGCRDPLRLLVSSPSFAANLYLPADFAHGTILVTKSRVRRQRRLIVCRVCGLRFRYVWWELFRQQVCALLLVISLVRPWLGNCLVESKSY